MPATRSDRARGITPIGVSVPSGVSTVTTSPGRTASDAARSLPSAMPSSRGPAPLSSGGAASASKRPAVIRLGISVTLDSVAGSTPFSVTNADRSPARTSAGPITSGAAPMTCGSFRSMARSPAGSATPLSAIFAT